MTNFSLINLPSPLVRLQSKLLEEKAVQIYMKRDDLIHPTISGNKWRKLKYNFTKMEELGKTSVLSFGGAFSNHIHALSALAAKKGIPSIGIIRGEDDMNNPSLEFARKCGMDLRFVDRKTYRLKNAPDYLASVQREYPNSLIIPEGGTNADAVKGVGEVIDELAIQKEKPFDYLAVSVGSGGTAMGLLKEKSEDTELLAFSSLKSASFEQEFVAKYRSTLGHDPNNYNFYSDYHFGGYAKVTEELVDFIHRFWEIYRIPLDPIYTAKMMYGVFDLIQSEYFAKGDTICCMHTGGLQGLLGYEYRFPGTFSKELLDFISLRNE